MKSKLPIVALASFLLAGCGTSINTPAALANNEAVSEGETSSPEGGSSSSSEGESSSEVVESSSSSESSETGSSESTGSSSVIEDRTPIGVDEARLVAWDIVARQDTLAVVNAYKDYKVSFTEVDYDEEGVATTSSYLDISSESNGYFAYDYGSVGKDYIASVEGVSYYITQTEGVNVGYSNEKLVRRATRELSDYIAYPIDIAIDVLNVFKADSLPSTDPVTEEVPALARFNEGVTSGDSSSSEDPTESSSSEIPTESSSEEIPPTSSESSSESSSETPVVPEVSESLLAYSDGEGDLLIAYAYSEVLEEKSLSVSAYVDIKEDLPVGVYLDIEGVYSANYVISYGTSEEERVIPEFTISEEVVKDEHDHHEHPWCPEGGDHGHGEGGSELDNPPSDDHGWGPGGDHGWDDENSTPEEPSTSEGDASSSSETTDPEVPGDDPWGHEGHPGGKH